MFTTIFLFSRVEFQVSHNSNNIKSNNIHRKNNLLDILYNVVSTLNLLIRINL